MDLTVSRRAGTQPWAGARLTEPRFTAAFLPAISSRNFAGGASRLFIPSQTRTTFPRVGLCWRNELVSEGALSAPVERTIPGYPLGIVWVGRVFSTVGSNVIFGAYASSLPAGTSLALQGGSSTSVFMLARNNFGTTMNRGLNHPSFTGPLNEPLVILFQSRSPSDHVICCAGAIQRDSTNIGSLAAPLSNLSFGNNSVNGIDHAFGGMYSGAFSDEELQALSQGPEHIYSMFQRRTYFPEAAASALPTLSAATFAPGSLTSSGFRPRVTAS
jgi:hypothetical protein